MTWALAFPLRRSGQLLAGRAAEELGGADLRVGEDADFWKNLGTRPGSRHMTTYMGSGASSPSVVRVSFYLDVQWRCDLLADSQLVVECASKSSREPGARLAFGGCMVGAVGAREEHEWNFHWYDTMNFV